MLNLKKKINAELATHSHTADAAHENDVPGIDVFIKKKKNVSTEINKRSQQVEVFVRYIKT